MASGEKDVDETDEFEGEDALAGRLRELADELDAGGSGRAAGGNALSPGALLKIIGILKGLLPLIEQAIGG